MYIGGGRSVYLQRHLNQISILITHIYLCKSNFNIIDCQGDNIKKEKINASSYFNDLTYLTDIKEWYDASIRMQHPCDSYFGADSNYKTGWSHPTENLKSLSSDSWYNDH